MTAAIDDVCAFFENTILALEPTSEPGRKFVLLGEEAGALEDQAINEGFFRLFDVMFGWDPSTGASHMPLERDSSVFIQIGYLGSMKSRRVRKVMRQDEELIARYLAQPSGFQAAHVTNRPYQWDIRPPHQMRELDDARSATILVIRYEVLYTCASV